MNDSKDSPPHPDPSECEVHLLSDEPADVDAFRAHDGVAKALADLIQSEPGGRAVAITGAWGSGKSTLVQLLRQHLSPFREETHVTTFDAWAHQADPLRRSFLESLIKDLIAKSWLKKKVWNRELAKLARRREDTITENAPVLKWGGVLFAVSLLLVPVGVALFAKYASSGTRGTPSRLGILGLILAGSPLVSALLVWLADRPTPRVWKTAFWKESRTHSSGIASLLLQKSVQVTKTTTQREPEPTSIEFQNKFEHAVGAALEPPERKLVIVMDNLDRVPESEALVALSTMRAFLDVLTGRKLNQLWVLVPIDLTALERLWVADADNEGESLAEAFRRKTFQVEFRVPPPVISRWRRFLLEQLKLALPAHSSTGEFDTLVAAFGVSVSTHERNGTPRDIKSFVNRLCSLHRIWRHTLPLAVQGLYAISEGDLGSDPVQKIREGSALDVRLMSFLGDDSERWQQLFAAIFFGLPPEEALQALLLPTIRTAISEGNSERISTLSSTNGFWEVMEAAVADFLAGMTEAPLAGALISVLEALKGTGNEAPDSIWRTIAYSALHVPAWPLRASVPHALGLLLDHAPSLAADRLREQLLRGLAQSTPPADDDTPSLAEWAETWAQATSIVRSNMAGKDQGIVGPKEVHAFLNTAIALGDIDPDAVKHLTRPGDPQELVSYLVTLAQARSLTGWHSRAISWVVSTPLSIDWSPLIEATSAALTGAMSGQAVEWEGCVRVLMRLSNTTEDARATLTQLVGAGTLHDLLYQAISAKAASAASIVTVALMRFGRGTTPAAAGNSSAGLAALNAWGQDPTSNGTALAKAIHDVRRYASLEDVALAAQSGSFGSVPAALLDRMKEDVDPDLVIDYYSFLDKSLSREDLISLLQKLVTTRNLVQKIRAYDFRSGDTPLYTAAFEASSVDGRHKASLARYLKDGLESSESDAWRVDLPAGPLSDLVTILITDGQKLELGPAFSEALLEFARKQFNVSDPPSITADRIQFFLESMRSDTRDILIKDIRDDLIVHASDNLTTFLTLFGPALANSDVLEEKAEDLVRRLFPEIFRKGSVAEAQWVKETIEAHPSLVAQANSSSQTAFREKLRATITNADLPEELRNIAEGILGPGSDEDVSADDNA